MPRDIITLTTDFGYSDPYVGIMKGVILGINPNVQLVDICHDLSAYDTLEAAYAVAQMYRVFPPSTIHLVVVDPGVGSARRPLVVSADRHIFVAPDNGVLSLVYAQEESVSVRHVTARHYFREPVSNTFHGRDVFAPVAAWLSRGVETTSFGEAIGDYVKFSPPRPARVSPHILKGLVVRVDRFGTLVTNMAPADLPELFRDEPASFKLVVGKTEISSLKTAYADAADGELFAIVGSMGFLEIAANRASASAAVGVGKGAEVGLLLS